MDKILGPTPNFYPYKLGLFSSSSNVQLYN